MNSWQLRDRDGAGDAARFRLTGDWCDRLHRRTGVSEAGYSSSISTVDRTLLKQNLRTQGR
ncbi:hypothetical protein [Microcoleus sp. S13_B4]|uniref:hypothetical protein n=1 Tax=Microcoleus sp. S13_B4 TaxID=3055408 RepID=UPI002FD2D7F7